MDVGHGTSAATTAVGFGILLLLLLLPSLWARACALRDIIRIIIIISLPSIICCRRQDDISPVVGLLHCKQYADI
jgi:hypothetical protein